MFNIDTFIARQGKAVKCFSRIFYTRILAGQTRRFLKDRQIRNAVKNGLTRFPIYGLFWLNICNLDSYLR